MRFNSTLVQLKGAYMGREIRLKTRFQFYLSSIKREKIDSKGIKEGEFQFYLSSIKSGLKLLQNFFS